MMKKNIKWLLLFLLFVFCIGLKLYIVYFGYINYHYIVPPGYDAIPHLNLINNLASSSWGYPKLFHYIAHYLSDLTHRDPFYILTYWTPTMIILPSLSIFFLLKQIFNLKTAGIATLFFLFTSNYPLYGFVDGNYPNILAYGFFAVLCIAFIIKYINTKKLFYLYISALFYILTGLTHHFSFAELNGILLLSLITMAITRQIKLPKLRFNVRNYSTLFLSLLLLYFLFIIYKIYGSQYISFFTGLISNKSVIQDAYLSQAVQYYRYPDIVGSLIWYGGTLGLFYMIITFSKSQKKDYTKLILFVWIILIYSLSRLPSSGLPERFARELAVPLIICFAYLINRLINHLDHLELNRLSIIFGYGFIIYFIIINSSLYNPALLDSLPNSFSGMVWYDQSDQGKSDYIKNNFSSDQSIYINPYANPYMKLMTKANLVDFSLSAINIDTYGKKKSSKKEKQDIINYDNMIKSLTKDNRGKVFYIFSKPESNPDGIVYPIFGGYDAYNDIMRDMVKDQKVIHKFIDSSFIMKIEK